MTHDTDFERAVEALRQADEVALACHVNPDGDALGSLLALSLGLRKLGIETRPTWGATPVTVPPALRFLPDVASLVQPTDLGPAKVFVALDCGASHRLGDVEAIALEAEVFVNIDHHPGNASFGTFNLVDTHASSTAEIVTHLLRALDVELDADIATCLYVGIVTDTGRFQFSNSSPGTLRLAADLLECGVDAPLIAQQVFDSAPYKSMHLLGLVLERATLHAEERFIYSWFTQKDLVDNGMGADETDFLVDAIRSTGDADVAAMFKEQDDGRYRVSLRSKGPSVGAIARARGGGGHELAAGYTTSDVATGVRQIVAGLEG